MWELLKKTPKRSIESVILPQEQKQDIIEDIKEFVSDATAQWYSDHGIPYKKVYLLHGDPGCGKSSFIGSIASHFNMNICFLQSNFKDMTDNFLIDLAHRVPVNSIMVMEDIDALFNNHRENDEAGNLTFSGVINMLDGLSCPFGQIIIMTTNYYEQLDHAMVRESRIDKVLEIKKPTKAEIIEIFKQFYPCFSSEANEFAEYFLPRKPSMASIQTVFVDYRRKGIEKLMNDIRDNSIEQRNQKNNMTHVYYS
jgi:chaperone BCS1